MTHAFAFAPSLPARFLVRLSSRAFPPRGVLHRLALVPGGRLRAGVPALADVAHHGDERHGGGFVSSRSSGRTSPLAMRSLRPRPFMVVTPQGPQTITMDPAACGHSSCWRRDATALMVGLFAGGQWERGSTSFMARPFGKTDPILGRDIGFYVFKMPLLERCRHAADPFFLMRRWRSRPTCSAATSALHPVRGLRHAAPRCGTVDCWSPRCCWCWPSAPGCRSRSC